MLKKIPQAAVLIAVCVAASQLLAPVLIAVLHQHALGGTQCRPLHLPGFVANHLDAFLRAYEVVRATPPKRPGLVPLSARRRPHSKRK